MKKTLAMLLSLAMVLSLSFGLAIWTSAEEEIPAVATEVYVGANSTEKDNYAVLNSENKTMAAGSGTLEFDPATGTLTMTNATVEGWILAPSTTGPLTVKLVGDNVINGYRKDSDSGYENYSLRGYNGLTITSDAAASLTAVNGDRYVIGAIGPVTITGKVTVTAAGKRGDGIHVGNNAKLVGDLTISGDAVVNVKNQDDVTTTNMLRSQDKDGKLIIKDNAKVNVTCTKAGDWCYGVKAPGFEMLSGELTVKLSNAQGANLGGIAIQGGEKGDNCVGLFSGGKIVLDLAADNAGKDNSRVYGVFCQGSTANSLNFCGTDITMKLAAAKPNDSASSGVSGAIAHQNGASVITVSDGTLNIDAGDIKGLFSSDRADAVINITGGKITGTAKSFFCAYNAGAAMNITGGEIDFTATEKVVSTASNPQLKCDVELEEGSALNNTATKLKTKATETPGTETPETPENPTDVKVENPAAEVVITKADGTTVALNKDNKTTDGATYDPATGKLTIEGLNAKKITVASGDVIVEVKGTNTLTNDEDVTAETADDPKADDGKATLRVPGKLFFVGNGKLTVTAKGYNIYSETAITFTDSVNVEVVSTGTVANAAPIYTPINSKSDDCVITFSGKAKVTGTTEVGPVIRQGASPWAYGKLILKDDAELNMTVKNCAGWNAAAFVTHWEISGGTMNVDVTGKDDIQAVSGIEVYAEASTREDRSATLNMTGGTVNIKVLAPITAKAGRPHGIFSLFGSELTFAGGTVNLDVKAASTTPTNSGAICVQWNNAADVQKENEFTKITVTGDAVINAKDCNSDGLFGISHTQTKVAIVINGGTIKGSDNTFVYDRVGKSTLEIKGGEIDWTSKTFNVKGATATATVNFKEGGVGPADTVIKTGTNPGTSDLAVALVSVIAVTSVVAAAAVLFVRKRRYN